MPLTLDGLTRGQRAIVRGVDGEGRYRRRLLEMGLVPGVEVQLVQVAPLGDPVTISLRGSRLSLRRGDAASIQVELPPVEDETETEAVSRASFRVAVVGNPNTGKTTLFNAFTGENAHVGNYPGITVDRKIGIFTLYEHTEVELVDVPGAYSLYARSRDEQVAIDELLGRVADGRGGAGLWQGGPPDAVMIVLDATQMDRSMYLLLQVQELAIPSIAVVNMLDSARRQGIEVDTRALSEHIGFPAVGVVARTGEGLEELRATLHRVLRSPPDPVDLDWHWRPSADLEAHLDELAPQVAELVGSVPRSRSRAIALWCLMSLEPDDDLVGIPDRLRAQVLAMRAHMVSHGHDLDLEVSQARYEHIDTDKRHYFRDRRTGPSWSDRLDAVLTHPVAGSLIFLGVLATVFTALFDLASPFVDLVDAGVGGVQSALIGLLPAGFVADFLVQGLLGGVGAVVVFLPQILILFFLITLLEASGYMARAAVVSDRVMTRLGLHGQALVPMISGFACAVPAIMATRTMQSRRDRLLTIMVLPLVSCSARLPVYTLFIAALFPATQRVLGPLSLGTVMMLALYLMSFGLTVVVAAVLGRTVLKGQPAPFLIELPPYRLPRLRYVLRVMWERSREFLRTAGTVIVVASTVLWVALSFPQPQTWSRDYDAAIAAAPTVEQAQHLEDLRRAEALEYSAAGRLGKLMEPAIQPLGFDWKIGVGLVGSFAAREVFVATMGLVYGVGEGDDATLREVIRRERRADGSSVYTPLTGLSLLMYFMIALQCVSTIAVTRQETGSWRWTALQFAYIQVLAYVASLLVYQGGLLLGF